MSEYVVLLVDNDQDFLAGRAELVSKAGYRVLTASTVDVARDLLENERIHLAVFDVRMVNDFDEHDVSGIHLAKEKPYRVIPKIILTDHPTFQAVREALGVVIEGLPPAVDFLDKRDDVEALFKAIDNTLDQFVRINQKLVIRGQGTLSFPHLVQLIDGGVPAKHLIARSGEMEDLLRKLFFLSAQITVDELLVSTDEYVLFKVFAYNAAGQESGYIVMCGRNQRIRDTMQRYREANIQQISSTMLDQSLRAETVHYGATAYRFVGTTLAEILPLKTFYRRNQLDPTLTALTHLYQQTLGPWYEKGRHHRRDESVIYFYDQWLAQNGIPQTESSWQAQIKVLCGRILDTGLGSCHYTPTHLTFYLPDEQEYTYPNPAAFVETHPLKVVSEPVWGVTHGGIKLDTILVSTDNRTWLVDFSQTGKSPLLQDFVSLEMAFKVDLPSLANMNLEQCWQIEQRLSQLARLTDEPNVQGLPGAALGLLRLIHQIRRSAQQLGGCSLSAYQVGLYAQMLAFLHTFQPTVHYNRRELLPYAYTLLAAALLLQDHIQTQTESLPQEARRGVWLDEQNPTLWLNGKPHTLTKNEWAILQYLFQNANQLCSRKDIVEKGLGETYTEDDQGRLNNAITRLRQKIEPDPQNARYLVTIHGYGYKFNTQPEG